LHLTLVRPNPEYGSTVWISTTSTAAKSCIAFSASLHPVSIPFLYYDHVTGGDFLKFLKLRTVTNRRLYLMQYFLNFCLFRLQLLPVSFVHCWYSSSSA
jgi:hypothetical protein